MKKLNDRFNALNSSLVGLLVLFGGIAFLFASCNLLVAGGRKDKAVAKAEKELKAAGLPPEAILVQRDGVKASPKTIQPYTLLLDRAEAKCLENRTELTLYIAAMTRVERQSDPKSTHLDMADYFASAVESSIKRKREDSCEPIYVSLMTQLKEQQQAPP